MRNMNAGDKAFFYHSNCKEPGIVGIMEIVKEFSQDSKYLQLLSTPSAFADFLMREYRECQTARHAIL